MVAKKVGDEASALRNHRIWLASTGLAEDARVAALGSLGWNIETEIANRNNNSEPNKSVPKKSGPSGPEIVLVDMRLAGPPNLSELGKSLETARGAMVAIIPDAAQSLAAFMAGATQILSEPFDTGALDLALMLASRQIDRLSRAGGRRRAEPIAQAPGKAVKGSKAQPAASQSELFADASALLLIGLKRFDAINAAFGRQTGDDLLIAVERRIRTVANDAAGESAIVKRSGGTDFILIPGPMNAASRLALADRIIVQLERPFMAGDHFVALGASIGIVETHAGNLEEEVFRRAQVALAAARDDDVAVRVLSAQDEGTALFDAGLETDLRRALDNNEIEVLFQPQVSVASGRIIGVEALARWRHPEHGELGAETLFSVAKRSDYLTALSAHVQRRAAAKAAEWPVALQSLRLSVNVTAEDIARPGFADTFLAMIDETGFPRERLTVEITENGLIDDLAAAAALLATLRAKGCRVAIDDFGTGYSSLAYLKALPLDYLKIDKHLAQDIAGTARDRIVVRGVIDMARSLGLAVVAEGVETEEQLTLLAREGCNYYQGFLCAVPLTVEALTDLVMQRSLPDPSTVAEHR